MFKPENNIIVTVSCEGEIYQLNTHHNEYRSLMMLILDKISPEDFGDCLGMGKCGTCLVEISGNANLLTSYNRNEEATIAKAGINTNFRLACQILVDENIQGIQVEVLRPK